VASSPLSTAAPTTSAAQTHPAYDIWAPVWRKLVQVFEGSGGFLDGTNLVAHPREWLDHSFITTVPQTELQADGTTITTGTKKVVTVNLSPSKPSAKLLERRRLARYENVAAPIIEHKLAALFRKPPHRQVLGGVKDKQQHAWLDWCENVDGAGTSMDDFMRDAWRFAAIFGHSVIVMDLNGQENPQTKADQGQPVLRLYSALDFFDWLTDETGALVGVRLYEVAPRTSFSDNATAAASRYRIRTLTDTTFEVTEETAKSENGGVKAEGAKTIKPMDEHGFGTLPVAILYGRRRALTPVIGNSVIGDPNSHYDLYNLASEKRELLRKQTFSILNIPLGTGPERMGLDEAQALAGETTGTTNVLFTGLAATYITADSGNVTVYQEEATQLLRTIYRLSNVPFETDTRDAESEGSMKLKREDMNQVLASYADELQRAEARITELYFRAEYGDRWEAEMDATQPETVYPENFELADFEQMIQRSQAALGLPLGRSKTFMSELSKRMASEFMPDLSQDVKAKIEAEIDALPDPEQERKQDREARLAGMDDAFKPKPGEDDDEGGGGAPASPVP
jgi:hypothetical protein